MKYLKNNLWILFLAYLLMVTLLSCQKEVSREGDFSRCGPIVAINIFGTQNSIDVDFGGNLVRIDLGVVQMANIKVGDTYCK